MLYKMEDNWLGVRGKKKKKGGRGEGGGREKLRNIILFQNPKILSEDILSFSLQS